MLFKAVRDDKYQAALKA